MIELLHQPDALVQREFERREEVSSDRISSDSWVGRPWLSRIRSRSPRPSLKRTSSGAGIDLAADTSTDPVQRNPCPAQLGLFWPETAILCEGRLQARRANHAFVTAAAPRWRSGRSAACAPPPAVARSTASGSPHRASTGQGRTQVQFSSLMVAGMIDAIAPPEDVLDRQQNEIRSGVVDPLEQAVAHCVVEPGGVEPKR